MLVYTLIIVVIAIIGLLMMGAVLLQSGKGGGLAGIASGGATTQILGSRQAPGTLEKFTWIMASAFIVLCILSNFFIGQSEQRESILQSEAQSQPIQTPLAPPQQTPPPAEEVPVQENQ